MEKFFKIALLALCLGPLGCGGGEGAGNTGANDLVGSKNPDMTTVLGEGNITVAVAPIYADKKPVEVILDDESKSSIVAGDSVTLTTEVGSHTLQIFAEGYGYAVPGYSWSTVSSPCSQWKMREVSVLSEAEVNVNASLCRDLTGKWKTSAGGGITSTWIKSDNGKCVSGGFDPINFKIIGDKLIVSDIGSSCDGIETKIENGNIVFDCGNGAVYTYTKQ